MIMEKLNTNRRTRTTEIIIIRDNDEMTREMTKIIPIIMETSETGTDLTGDQNQTSPKLRCFTV